MTFEGQAKAAFIMYATGGEGGQRFFLQQLVLLYPPQGPYKCS